MILHKEVLLRAPKGKGGHGDKREEQEVLLRRRFPFARRASSWLGLPDTQTSISAYSEWLKPKKAKAVSQLLLGFLYLAF